jgi:cell division protein FtsQ
VARADAGVGVDSVSLFRAALVIFATLVALIGAVLVSEWFSRSDVFPVRAVRFEGVFQHVTQAQLAAAVAPAAQGNFLQLDLDAVKARAESLPWVYQAEVRRRWPRDLLVRVHEQQLTARWNSDAWVNQALQAVRVPDPTLPADVPQLEGPEGTQAIVYERWQEFGRLLVGAGLQLRRLTLTPRRTWQIELTNGLRLVLDRVQPDRKLERFARVYARALARAGMSARVVDLRYTNGFAVEWNRGASVGRAPSAERMKSATHRSVAQEEG